MSSDPESQPSISTALPESADSPSDRTATPASSGLTRRKFLRGAFSAGALAAAALTGSVASTQLRQHLTPLPPSMNQLTPAAGPPVGDPQVSAAVTSSTQQLSAAPPVETTDPGSTPTPGQSQTSAQSGVPVKSPGARQPNVVLITVDTLRADRIGAYGFRQTQTPTLDRLAREGARFERAICQLPQTNASHAALLTGLYPSTNGVKIHMVDKLSPKTQTMASVFQGSGYRTGAIYSWVSLDPQFCGLNQGFQTYDGYVLNRSLLFSNPRLEQLAALYRQLKQQLPIVKTADAALNSSDSIERSLDGRADVTNAAVFDWLATHADSGPFFLWVHYFDPHYPYAPPPGYDHAFGLSYDGKIDGSIDTIQAIENGKIALADADRARLGELYQGEIAYVDAQIGLLFGEFGRRGIFDDTVIALTGDHGESFGEHGDWTHGLKVFESEIRVPLLIRYPARVPAGVTVTPPVQLVDVMPTLLELTGLRSPEPVQGSSLLPLIEGAIGDQSRIAFTELSDESFVSMLTPDWKMIRNNANGELQLYRLSDDEGELRDLVRSEPRVTQDLQARLQEMMKISGVTR